MRRAVLFFAGLSLLLAFASCSSPAAPTPTPGELTAEAMAARGQQVYSQNCAVCHDDGLGGNLKLGLTRFPDAGEMFSYARANMPRGSPGTLRSEDYAAVIVKVLVDNQVVSPGAVIDPNKLSEIKF